MGKLRLAAAQGRGASHGKNHRGRLPRAFVLGEGSGGWRCHVTPPNGLDYFTLTPIAALADAEADGYRVVEELRKARAALLAATGAA